MLWGRTDSVVRSSSTGRKSIWGSFLLKTPSFRLFRYPTQRLRARLEVGLHSDHHRKQIFHLRGSEVVLLARHSIHPQKHRPASCGSLELALLATRITLSSSCILATEISCTPCTFLFFLLRPWLSTFLVQRSVSKK